MLKCLKKLGNTKKKYSQKGKIKAPMIIVGAFLLHLSPIVDTHTGFQVQLSIHIRIKIKKEDIVYPLVDIDSILQKVFCLPDYADPLTKDGIVGAFNRAYSISEAIDVFLSDIYEEAGGNRYKYIPSSSVAGAINYDDKLFYSHHANDPAVGQTLSAFNLVRIHLFGDDKPSFKKMVDFARNDEKVKNLIAEENIKSIKEDFGDEEIDFSWTKKLETNDDGDIANTDADEYNC